MDPTGLLSLIPILYWSAALTALAVALVRPKSVQGKLASAAVVTIVFGALPFAGLVTSYLEKDIREQSCSKSTFTAEELEPVQGYYAALESITHMMLYEFAVRHLTEKKMSFFETDNVPRNKRFGAFLHIRGGGPLEGADSPYLRFYLSEEGDPACRWFEHWIKEYPAQKLPMLRRKGLSPAHCVATRGVEQLESRYRIHLTETPVRVESNAHGIYQHHLWIEDALSKKTVVDFNAFFGHYYGSYQPRSVLCGKEREYAMLTSAVKIVPDKRYVQLPEEIDETHFRFPIEREASDEDIDAYIALQPELGRYTSNNVSRDGQIWVDSGYYLVITQHDKRRKVLIRFHGIPGGIVHDFRGLAVSPDKLAIIAYGPDRMTQWLLEYSISGTPLRALSLTPQQHARIGK